MGSAIQIPTGGGHTSRAAQPAITADLSPAEDTVTGLLDFENPFDDLLASVGPAVREDSTQAPAAPAGYTPNRTPTAQIPASASGVAASTSASSCNTANSGSSTVLEQIQAAMLRGAAPEELKAIIDAAYAAGSTAQGAGGAGGSAVQGAEKEVGSSMPSSQPPGTGQVAAPFSSTGLNQTSTTKMPAASGRSMPRPRSVSHLREQQSTVSCPPLAAPLPAPFAPASAPTSVPAPSPWSGPPVGASTGGTAKVPSSGPGSAAHAKAREMLARSQALAAERR